MSIMVIMNRTTSQSFVITWDVVNDLFDVTYMVTWTDGNALMRNDNTTNTFYTVIGLTNNTNYNVTVTAINTCCGAGPTTPPLVVGTNELPPTQLPTDPPGMYIHKDISNYISLSHLRLKKLPELPGLQLGSN